MCKFFGKNVYVEYTKFLNILLKVVYAKSIELYSLWKIVYILLKSVFVECTKLCTFFEKKIMFNIRCTFLEKLCTLFEKCSKIKKLCTLFVK